MGPEKGSCWPQSRGLSSRERLLGCSTSRPATRPGGPGARKAAAQAPVTRRAVWEPRSEQPLRRRCVGRPFAWLAARRSGKEGHRTGASTCTVFPPSFGNAHLSRKILPETGVSSISLLVSCFLLNSSTVGRIPQDLGAVFPGRSQGPGLVGRRGTVPGTLRRV